MHYKNDIEYRDVVFTVEADVTHYRHATFFDPAEGGVEDMCVFIGDVDVTKFLDSRVIADLTDIVQRDLDKGPDYDPDF